MEFTARELEDFHLRERKWICSQVDLRKVLKAQGWKPIEDKTNTSPTAMKLQSGWDKIAVDKRGEGIWMWYKYTQKIGGTLYDRINPDISNLPHGDDVGKQNEMIKVMRQSALRSFARQFIPKEELIGYYADKREILMHSITQGEKVLKGEIKNEVKTSLVSLVKLAPKYGFKPGEMKSLRQYFHFENKDTKITISVPVQDPYVYIEHGEKKRGGGVKDFKERYHMLRQIELPMEVSVKQVTKNEHELSMAAEPQKTIKMERKEPARSLQVDMFQDTTTKRGLNM